MHFVVMLLSPKEAQGQKFLQPLHHLISRPLTLQVLPVHDDLDNNVIGSAETLVLAGNDIRRLRFGSVVVSCLLGGLYLVLL